uniref:NADH-ubiquinone oxidoreductase chain 6 n=1 Tax=Dryocoetes villosus TaxID=1367338 RepID=A0A343A4Y6_9CUCU|nr:NADH dehydrogenase subunit 6 [Dryocoetes villosus]AOY39614.1 NADH dehydrogenase subunit 6 [Dryocoetes villosus]
MLILYMLNWLLSLSFIILNHPLSLGFILLLLTINISLTSGIMYLNFWFGYLLFLIMVGGILVMFIYMTSIASNEKFNMPSLYSMMLFFTAVISFMILSMTLDSFFATFPNLEFSYLNQDILNMQNKSLTKIFSKPLNQLPVALMSYLLLCLITVVKMTENKMGPLRQK